MGKTLSPDAKAFVPTWAPLGGETKAAAPVVAAPAARGAWAVQGAAREAYLKAEAERKRKADEEAAAAAALNGATASAGSGPGAAESSAPSSPVAAGAAPDEKVATALFTFGIIADIQYADADDGTNFKGDSTRRYRNALEITKSAVRDWSKHVKKGGVAGWGPKSDMAFVAQLGDVIDGRNRSAGKSHAALATVLRELNKAPTSHFVHLIGNHELYNFARKDLSGLLPSNPPGLEKSSSVGWGVKAPAYFSFIPHEQWRVVALDAYDVSTLAPTSQDPEEAFRLLADKNPNDVRQTDVDFTAGLSGVEKRWVPYNGGLGDAQLVWLEETLKKSQAARQRVIILSHVAVCPGSANDSTLLWNYEKVMALIAAYSCVAAVLCGHDHSGGYKNEGGVHHVTVESPLECDVGDKAYGLMLVGQDRLTLAGMGKTPSRDLPLRPFP